MKEVIVSIRMPKTMLDHLKILAKKNHYLDVSEEIRAVIKEKTKTYSTPYNQDVKRIVNDLQTELKSREQQDKRKDTIQQLKKMLEELEHA